MPGRDALLATKIGAQPRGARPIDRARLRALLDGAPEARLVLVSAPAGFGKSTLLAAWLDRADVHSAWLSLDRRDEDIVRFTRYLEAAVARLSGRGDEPVERDPSWLFDAELALASVIDHVVDATANRPSGAVVIVLDDYHVVGEPAIHRLVGSLIERLPPRARLAIATRSDPPLPLAQLRARGELLEIRAAELRFTAGEADELLRTASVELPPGDVADLAERTEGWAAALRLAAVSLRGRPDQAERVRRFGASHRFILDYVVEQVLAGLPPGTQEFLLRTSILDRLCGSLCDAVSGKGQGQARLEELERANLLIVPLDDERRWYRYHALFAEVLRARLAMLHASDVPDLHARAAAWHETRGDDDEAIRHGLQSGDLAHACQLVAEASLRHLNAGELSTVRRWIDALPPEAVSSHPQLSVSSAWCLALAGETDGVADLLAQAEHALAAGHGDGPVADAAIRTQLALLRSRLADLDGDPQTAIAQARLAHDLVPRGLPAEAEATLRGDASVLLARALASAGDVEGATEAYTAALPDLRAGGNMFAVGRAIADLAAFAIARGDAAGAVGLCEGELGRAPSPSAATLSSAVWAALARAHLQLGQVGVRRGRRPSQPGARDASR